MGDAFAALTNFEFSGNDVFRRRNWMKTKNKKNVSPKIEVIFPRNQVKTSKKKDQFVTTLGRKFIVSFSPGWLFFHWSFSAQLSMGGR